MSSSNTSRKPRRKPATELEVSRCSVFAKCLRKRCQMVASSALSACCCVPALVGGEASPATPTPTGPPFLRGGLWLASSPPVTWPSDGPLGDCGAWLLAARKAKQVAGSSSCPSDYLDYFSCVFVFVFVPCFQIGACVWLWLALWLRLRLGQSASQ